jgi:hypothetical protein
MLQTMFTRHSLGAPVTMDAITKLQYLSLVSKVVTELDNHLGLKDKDLAEFIIKLADESTQLSVRLLLALPSPSQLDSKTVTPFAF